MDIDHEVSKLLKRVDGVDQSVDAYVEMLQSLRSTVKDEVETRIDAALSIPGKED